VQVRLTKKLAEAIDASTVRSTRRRCDEPAEARRWGAAGRRMGLTRRAGLRHRDDPCRRTRPAASADHRSPTL